MGQEIFSLIPKLGPGVFIFSVAYLTSLLIQFPYIFNIVRPITTIILCYKKLEGRGI